MNNLAPGLALFFGVSFGAMICAPASYANGSAISSYRSGWEPNAAYRVGAIVSYNGVGYVCVSGNTGVEPNAKTHKWRVLNTAATETPMPARSNESGITSGQANEILSELRAIRQLLERSAPPVSTVEERVAIALRDSPVMGSDQAPLTLVEFADYQCPYCRRFHMSVFDDIKKNYIDSGKLRYISRDLPLPMHDHASQAANAARCADEQHHFWEMRHLLIANSQKLAREDLLSNARDLQLNMAAFTECLDQNKYDAAIQRDAADAADVGIAATPSFVLGATVKNGPFRGTKIVGTQSYAVFDEKIRAMMDRH